MILLQKFVRFTLNRFACLLFMVLFFFTAIWWVTQVYPIVASSFKQEDLFYGFAHEARQSPLFGRVVFQINEDNNASFVLWMNPANRARFDTWFGPDQGLRIEAVRATKNTWVVVGLDCAEGSLNREELSLWRTFAELVSIVFTFIFTLSTYALGKEYFGYFRFRPWLRRRP